MKKLSIFLIILSFFSFKSFSQTYTQTFIDKCSGEKKIATTTMMNGYATVSFYNQVKTFTSIEVQTGVLQTWLLTTKATYEALTCPVINNPVVQQTVANAAAQAASNAASQAASSAASTAASSSASSAASSSASSAATSSANSTPSTSSSTSSTTSSSSSSESKSNGSSTSEQKSESKSESKTEEKKSESKSEEKKEESKSEEKQEDSKKEKKEEKEEKKKEKVAFSNPMLLSSDLSTIESPDGRWLQSATIGVSRASMAGDESYSANAVIMSDLKTFIVSGGYTKMNFSNGKLNGIHSYSSSFAYLNGTYMNLLGYTYIKPTLNKGVFGYNLGLINLFIKNQDNKYDYNMSTSVVAFWTKPYQYNKKLSISPQVFTMFAPLSWNSVAGTSTVNRQMGFLLGSSFDYKLSKRFGFSINYKLSGNTAAGSPLLSNFLIGSRMVL